MWISRGLAAITLAVALVACRDSDPIEPEPDVARAVIANVAFGTADVDVVLNGTTTIATDLDFAEYTAACLALPAGTQITLTFRSGTTVLATVTPTLTIGDAYTILVTDDASGTDAIVMADDAIVPTGQRAVRFVNASDDPVDGYMFVANEAMGDPAVTDLAYAGSLDEPPDYLFRDASQTVIRFFEPGVSSGPPLAEETLPSAAIALGATVILTETNLGMQAYSLGPC